MADMKTALRIREAYDRVGGDKLNTYEVGGPFPAFATLLRMPPGRMDRAFVEDFELFVPTRPLELNELSGGHARRKFSYRSGMVAFNSPGAGWSISWDGVIEGLSLIITREVMERAVRDLFGEDPATMKWRMALSDNAPAIAYLGLDLVSQASIGYPAGERHFEQVSRALFSMIIRRYAQTADRDTATVGITSRSVLAAIRHIEQNLGEPLSVQSICDATASSSPQLNRQFRTELGQSVWAYVQQRRLKAASELLRETDSTVGEIGAKTGFPTRSNFLKAFRAAYGQSPSEFRAARSG